MEGNPWGNAWSDINKDPVQEVTLKPKDDKWITSPVSGDIGVAWTSEWDVPSKKQSTLQPTQGIFPSTSAPWESALGAFGDSIESPAVDDAPEPQVEEPQAEETIKDEPFKLSSAPVSFEEPFRDDEPLTIKNTVDEVPQRPEEAPDEVFDKDDIAEDTWKSLSHAAIAVGGDEAAWDSAWKPDAEDIVDQVESKASPVDEWSLAMENKVIRDTRIPPEVMEMILKRFNELSEKMWPGIDLESARAGPAPRDEWQGGMENVDGLIPLVNRYIPPPPAAPPIRFDSTQIASSFNNAMRLTRSYGLVQSSPLSRLVKASDTWEQSARKDKQFSLESWLLKGASLPLPSSNVSTGDNQSKPTGIMGIFSRPSLDRGSQSSPTPRLSQDFTSPITTSSTNITPVNSVTSPTATPAPSSTAAPSAVSRFLNRWSRKSDDPKPPTPVNLRSDELDFLDMIPEIQQGAAGADAIRKELGDAAAYPGVPNISFGGMATTSAPTTYRRSLDSSKRKGTIPSTNLAQLSSADFDSLLDAQIMEVEDEKLKESLIAASLISAPTQNTYSSLNVPFWGKKPAASTAGAIPLDRNSSSQSNTLFDDDDFDAFLDAPTTKPAQAQSFSQPTNNKILPTPPPSAPTSYPQPALPPTPISIRPIPLNRISPAPSRTPTIAIMNQGSRPSTPSTLAAAPLLPPPPGRTPNTGNLLNGGGVIAPPPSSKSNGTSAFGKTGVSGGMADMNLFDFTSPVPAAPVSKPLVAKPVGHMTSPSSGGLSAQDLSFFEGL